MKKRYMPLNLQYFADPEPTDPPKTDPPKADPPKADPPKAEPPKADPPKADPPKKGPTETELKAELRAAMADAGVPKEKRDYVMRLAKVDGADQDGADLGKLCETAVAKVLEDIPELGVGASTGSIGNFARKAAQTDYSKMTDEQYYAQMTAEKAAKK